MLERFKVPDTDKVYIQSDKIFELNDKPIMSLYEDSSKVDYLVA